MAQIPCRTDVHTFFSREEPDSQKLAFASKESG
jgi:hypothetical protein